MSLLNILYHLCTKLLSLAACSIIITFFSGTLYGQLLLSLALVYLIDSLVSLWHFLLNLKLTLSCERCPCLNGSTGVVSLWPRRILV